MGVKIRLCGLGMGAVWYCGMVVLRIVLYWRRYILCSIDFDAFKKDGREGAVFILGPTNAGFRSETTGARKTQTDRPDRCRGPRREGAKPTPSKGKAPYTP